RGQFASTNLYYADLSGYARTNKRTRHESTISHRRAGPIGHYGKADATADEAVECRELIDGDGVPEREACRRGSANGEPARFGNRWERHQDGAPQGLELYFLCTREPMPSRKHYMKSFCAEPLRDERVRHVCDVAHAKIS